MDLAEVEFLAQNTEVKIVPNFSHDKIYLIEVCKVILCCKGRFGSAIPRFVKVC